MLVHAVALLLCAEPLPDALLQKLSDHAARLEQLNQSTAISIDGSAQDFDGDGKLAHSSVFQGVQTYEAGKRHTRLARAVKDGEDVLADAQKEQDKRDASERLRSPFLKERQPHYTYELDGHEDGLAVVRFTPVAKGKEWLEGRAWVDEASGETVRLEGRPSELPAFVDKLEFKLEFGAQTKAGHALSRLRLDAAGGFLMIKRSGNVQMTFSYPPGA